MGVSLRSGWSRVTLAVGLLIGASSACTALLGATDVPTPEIANDAAVDSPPETSALADDTSGDRADASNGSGSGGSSSGGSSSGSSTSGSSGGGSSGAVTCGSTLCSSSHAQAVTCSGSTCQYTCASGWDDCDASPPNAGGCSTPVTSTVNCGACGVACDTSTGAPACVGTTCTYQCNPQRVDCNATNGPDTDGCECTTPGCCGTSCQTVHDDGQGQSFYDCNPQGTFNSASAFEACQAYAAAMGADAGACTDNNTCGTGPATYVSVCFNCTRCWNYTGRMFAGTVDSCNCGSTVGRWN